MVSAYPELTLISLAHQIKATVVAEGVETVGQREKLRQFSCPFVQGYLFSEPLAQNDLIHWLCELPRKIS